MLNELSKGQIMSSCNLEFCRYLIPTQRSRYFRSTVRHLEIGPTVVVNPKRCRQCHYWVRRGRECGGCR